LPRTEQTKALARSEAVVAASRGAGRHHRSQSIGWFTGRFIARKWWTHPQLKPAASDSAVANLPGTRRSDSAGGRNSIIAPRAQRGLESWMPPAPERGTGIGSKGPRRSRRRWVAPPRMRNRAIFHRCAARESSVQGSPLRCRRRADHELIQN